MIYEQSFSYLKATTFLFSETVCRTLSDMCNVQFSINKESLRECTFSTPFHIVLFMSFTGTINGYYILSLDESLARKLIGSEENELTPTQKRDLREEYGGLLKEIINIAATQSLEELEKSFYGLTIFPATIVFGEIEFPHFTGGNLEIEGREGKMVCGFLLNMANLKIGNKLEETLKELETKSIEVRESRKNIETILSILPIGLLAINEKGTILPGFSTSTLSIIGRDQDAEVSGQLFHEFIGLPESLYKNWKNWLALVFEKYGSVPFNQIIQLCTVSEFTNRFKKQLVCTWLPMTTNNKLDKLLIVIEDYNHRHTSYK